MTDALITPAMIDSALERRAYRRCISCDCEIGRLGESNPWLGPDRKSFYCPQCERNLRIIEMDTLYRIRGGGC